jgi:hypothetical protein
MKYLILGAMMLFNVCAASTQTTLKIFNYITKGYKEQQANGLDVKKGYKLEEIGTEEHDGFYMTIKAFHRIKDGAESPTPRAIMVEMTGNDLIEPLYFCIPAILSDELVWEAYRLQIKKASDKQARALCFTMSQMASYYALFLPIVEPDMQAAIRAAQKDTSE